jgi:HK97 gp10 family phage protein
MLRADVNSKQLQNVIRNVRGLDKQTRNKAENVINFYALKIESGAKQRVPVDTGRLRSSIKTEKFGSIGRRVYTNVEYAPYVEFGTREKVETTIAGVDYSNVAIQFKRSNGEAGGVSARPFLFPAFEQERRKIIKALKALVNGKR